MKLTVASWFTSRFWLLPNYNYTSWVPSANSDNDQRFSASFPFIAAMQAVAGSFGGAAFSPSRTFLFRALGIAVVLQLAGRVAWLTASRWLGDPQRCVARFPQDLLRWRRLCGENLAPRCFGLRDTRGEAASATARVSTLTTGRST